MIRRKMKNLGSTFKLKRSSTKKENKLFQGSSSNGDRHQTTDQNDCGENSQPSNLIPENSADTPSIEKLEDFFEAEEDDEISRTDPRTIIEDELDDDNIDAENVHIPLKTIAINEILLFPGENSRNPVNKKDREANIGFKKKSKTKSSDEENQDARSGVVEAEVSCKSSKKSSKNSSQTTILGKENTDEDFWDDGLDTLSVRTEDIFTNDGELVPSFRNVSNKDLVEEASKQPKIKKEVPTLQKNSPSPHLIHTHVLTPFRISKTDWNVAYENLTLRKCVENIPTEKFHLSRKTLRTLKFVQLTSFKLIENLLSQTFSVLTKLIFSNVTLVQKKSYSNPKSQILSGEKGSDGKKLGNSKQSSESFRAAPSSAGSGSSTIFLAHVRELEMAQWVVSLTKNEYWLLDVFTRSAQFGKLESFTFRGSDFVVGEKNLHKSLKLQENIKDPSVLVRFLYKNRGSLKKISFGGVGFKMMENHQLPSLESDLAIINNLKEVRVTMTTVGVNFLLSNQKFLENLTLTGYVTDFDANFSNVIKPCIESNEATLRSIGIFPCILNELGRAPGLQNHHFNCAIFESCQKLKSLFVNITTAAHIYSRRYSCGKATNLHLLPKSLNVIEIYNFDFDNHELEKFAGKIQNFSQLQRLTLSTTATLKYALKLEWIKNLFSLGSFTRADFFGGRLENPKVFRDFLLASAKRQKGSSIKMAHISDCISFYKAEVQVTPENKIPYGL